MVIAEVTDLILRGGVIGLCALLAFQLASFRPVRPVALIGIVFVFCSAIYAVKGIAGMKDAIGNSLFLALEFPGFIVVVFFWMFVRALILDHYRFGWADIAALAFNSILFIPVCVTPASLSGPSKIIHLVVSLLLIGDALRVTVLTRSDDLVESRRDFAKAMTYIISIIGLVIAIFVVLETLKLLHILPSVAQSAVIFATILIFVGSVSSLRDNLLAVRTPMAKPVDDSALPPADRLELARLRTLMEHGVFLEPALSIGSLATKMNVPEHRLRRLINNHLGHRNFASFINDQRIEEAKRRLGDGNLAREQITGLAFDLGFASLAPFNRAFRDRVGMSPSEFRNKALTTAMANQSHPLHS